MIIKILINLVHHDDHKNYNKLIIMMIIKIYNKTDHHNDHKNYNKTDHHDEQDLLKFL